MANADKLDIRIISLLRKDARQSFRDMADRLSVSEGTVYNRVAKLKREGILRGFVADIDWGLLGYDLCAIIGIKAAGGKLSQVEESFAMQPNVSAVYDVTGEYDAIVIAKFRDRRELNSLVKKMTAADSVERTYTMVVLNVIKEEQGVMIDIQDDNTT